MKDPTRLHVGAICDDGPSHIMAAGAIGRAFESLGHRFTLFGFRQLAPWMEKQEVSCCYLPRPSDQPVRATGPGGKALSAKESVAKIMADAQRVLRELPSALERSEVDGMLIDCNVHAAGSVANALDLPYVTFHNSLYAHNDPAVPPPIHLPWRYRSGVLGRLRNRALFAALELISRPIVNEINRFRGERGLRKYSSLLDAQSPLAQITQLVAEFDFPRSRLPANFHYVGPYTRRKDGEADFPFERLDGRPLVYASFGTIVGPSSDLWPAIAKACADCDVQLVIALGSHDPASTLARLPGDPIVVAYAPQESLLARAALFITHAGINSVLESMAHAVPMLAIPFLWDQFTVADRIVYHHLGSSLGLRRRSSEAIRNSVRNLLVDTHIRQRCLTLSKVVLMSRGADAAAKIIEKAVTTRRPVLRPAS